MTSPIKPHRTRRSSIAKYQVANEYITKNNSLYLYGKIIYPHQNTFNKFSFPYTESPPPQNHQSFRAVIIQNSSNQKPIPDKNSILFDQTCSPKTSLKIALQSATKKTRPADQKHARSSCHTPPNPKHHRYNNLLPRYQILPKTTPPTNQTATKPMFPWKCNAQIGSVKPLLLRQRCIASQKREIAKWPDMKASVS